MSTLLEHLQKITRDVARRAGLPEPDEFLNEALCSETEPLPPPITEELRKHFSRAADKFRKRNLRRSAKHTNTVNEIKDTREQLPERTSEIKESSAVVEDQIADQFEQEAVLAVKGLHPEFDSFADFARSRRYCSIGHAYRRFTRFKQRNRE